MDTQPDLSKAVELQAFFMFSEELRDDAGYLKRLEYMILSTVLRNAEITHNQLRGLMRNQYAIPEEMTTDVVNKLLSQKLGLDDHCALLEDVVKHENNGVTRIAQHLRCHPVIRSQSMLARTYAGSEGHFKMLEAFTPERYRRSKPRTETHQ